MKKNSLLYFIMFLLMNDLSTSLCRADDSGSYVRGTAIHTDKYPMPSDSVQRNDLENEHLDSWDRYKVVSENSIRVYFTAGTSKCYGQRAVIKESDDSIYIAIIEGFIPGSPPECSLSLLAMNTSFLLYTEKPIAGRSILPLRDVKLLKLNRNDTRALPPLPHKIKQR